MTELGATAEPVPGSAPGPAAPAAPDSGASVGGDPGPSAAPVVAPSAGELDGLAGRDLAEHPDVYQRIHAELQTALAAIDDA